MNKVVPLRNLLAYEVEEASASISVIMVVYMTGPALFTAIARVLADPDVDDDRIGGYGEAPADQAPAVGLIRTARSIRVVCRPCSPPSRAC